LEDTGVDGRLALEWIFKKWDVGIDWVDLYQDRERWCDFLDAVMKLWVP
jgi:hypothetical protein